MLGSPASPRKRPFELLSDLVDDGGFGEDLHPERWDVSALDEMARYTKLGLGVGGELLACSEEAVLMGRWGRSREEQEEEEEEERRRRNRHTAPSVNQEVQATAAGREGRISVATTTEKELCVAGRATGGGQDGGMSREHTVEVYQVAQEEEEVVAAAAAAGLALEHCSEEHNYSLSQGGELGAGPGHNPQTEEVQVGETQQEVRGMEESQDKIELDLEDEDEEQEEEDEEEDEEEEEEGEEGAEETAVEAELSSSSETECGEFCFHFVCICVARTSRLITALPAARLPTRKPFESVSGPDETSDRLVRLGWLSRGTLNTKVAGVIPGQHTASVAAVLLF